MKKYVFLALTLSAVLMLAACSRTTPPSVTPDQSPTPTASQPQKEDTGGDHNGLAGDIGDDVGEIMDDVGNAVDDAARGIGSAARDMTR